MERVEDPKEFDAALRAPAPGAAVATQVEVQAEMEDFAAFLTATMG